VHGPIDDAVLDELIERSLPLGEHRWPAMTSRGDPTDDPFCTGIPHGDAAGK